MPVKRRWLVPRIISWKDMGVPAPRVTKRIGDEILQLPVAAEGVIFVYKNKGDLFQDFPRAREMEDYWAVDMEVADE